MSDKSRIEWTDATWNPVTGCTKITRGCDHCYAERFAERFRGVPGHPFAQGFDVRLHPDRLSQPLSWKRPRRIFVNSMSDLFHKRIPGEFVDRVFDTMEATDRHVYQILTKRSSRMATYLRRRYARQAAPQHIWCGVSIEDRRAAARIRHLQRVPIVVRFLSIEPLLGPIDNLDLEGISWVIVGGESGPHARPVRERWVLDIRDVCKRAGVHFFFKQWGGRTPKSGGRRLEGIEHNARPLTTPQPVAHGRETMKFSWHLNTPPPLIEQHSKAKLTVLRSYLRAYFDRLNVNPQREDFRLDLVDGFAGGGTFSDSGETLPGTPLIMLEEAEAAKKRLNWKRRKALRFDCKFYFVEKEMAHAEHLRRALTERGHRIDDDRIVVRNGRFEYEVDDILKEIRRRQPRAGRAIFLLDQTGFSQVNLALVARIFRELPAAEVILTFAADALINHLAETPQQVKAVAPIQLTESQIHDLIRYKEGSGGKALVQRVLRAHARTVTGADYDTPFFIRPDKSRQALWFLHLSRHPTARDVMIQCHWDHRNTFEHYGPGDFGMLGWEALESKTVPLFRFSGIDAKHMKSGLLESLPNELARLASDQPVTVDAVRHTLSNKTPARFLDLDEIILDLFREKEFDLLNPDGKVRSRTLRHIRPTDRIALPSMFLLPGLSRRR